MKNTEVSNIDTTQILAYIYSSLSWTETYKSNFPLQRLE